MGSPIPAGSFASSSASRAEPVSIAEVFRSYLTFRQIAVATGGRDLAHRLVLCEPLSVSGEAPLIAASIASAASLCIESDPVIVRQSIRSGAIDFTVNNLDEALRALKNEIRKGLSIAVCLEGDPAAVLAEMADRGVQPDLVCGSGPAVGKFFERGARPVSFKEEVLPDAWIGTTWRVQRLPGKWLPMVDEVVASTLPAGDHVRRDWLKRAPRYMGRAMRTDRYVPLTDDEMNECAERLRMHLAEETWSGAEMHFESSHGRVLFTTPTSAVPASRPIVP